MLAYHNDTQLKESVLALMVKHREADRLVKGIYWQDGKGCAVGCTLESIRSLNGQLTIEHGSHQLYEEYLGMPRVLARLEDAIFEALPNCEAQAWPERFLSAIRPGADLSMVWPRFLHNLLTDPKGGVQIGAAKRGQVAAAVKSVADLFGAWIRTGQRPADAAYAAAAAAADAAYADAAAASADAASAAAAAAADAAYADAAAAADAAYADAAASASSAADAAAYAAPAADAARVNERRRQADCLIALLQAAPLASSTARTGEGLEAMSVTDWEIQQAMFRYGGSFAQAIAEAWSRADLQNEAKLKAAFPELFDEYRELARMRKERELANG